MHTFIIYTFIHLYMYIFIHLYIYTCTHLYIYTFIPLYIYTFCTFYTSINSYSFPRKNAVRLKKNLHETGSLSEKVHGCRILPLLTNTKCASQERATQRCDFSRIAAGKTIFWHLWSSHEAHSICGRTDNSEHRAWQALGIIS